MIVQKGLEKHRDLKQARWSESMVPEKNWAFSTSATGAGTVSSFWCWGIRNWMELVSFATVVPGRRVLSLFWGMAIKIQGTSI